MTQQLTNEPPIYYPVFLDLRGRRCLVVGGGEVAVRKVKGLLEVGARVTVIAPDIIPMPAGSRVLRRAFRASDVCDMALVIAATNNPETNRKIAYEARRRYIWVNVVDDQDTGSVILPAVVKRGSLRMAISTGGASPLLACRLKEQLENQFGEEYGRLVNLLWRLRGEFEPRADEAELSSDARKAAWEGVLALPLIDQLRANNEQAAVEAATAVLDKALAK